MPTICGATLGLFGSTLSQVAGQAQGHVEF